MRMISTTILSVIMVAWFGFYTDLPAADTVYRGASTTLAWDAVTTYEDGTPIEPAYAVLYKRHLKNMNTGIQAEMGEGTATSAVYTLPVRGQFRAGVQAVLKDGATVIDTSDITWSDNAEACAGGQTFLLRNLWPKWPVNFRR